MRAQQAKELPPIRFLMCQGVVDENGWPWELLDLKTLLDGETIVLHYLGPHELGAASLGSRFRGACKLHDALETVGIDVSLDHSRALDVRHGCSRGCGSSGLGSGGCVSGGCQIFASSRRHLCYGVSAGLRIAGVEYRESQRGPGRCRNGQTGQFA